MKLDLRRTGIDQKELIEEKEGMVEKLGDMRNGRRERIEKGSRERIEKERKERKEKETKRS